jgi:hypothetical protein
MDANELFSNKLFLQFLAGAGQDISSNTMGNNQGMPNTSAALQQNIKSQNYMKLLKQLLGPDDTKGTFGKDGLTLKIPTTSSMFSEILGGGGGEGPFKTNPSLAPDASPTKPSALTNFTLGGGAGAANPFSTSQPDTNISAADLAGLTPEDISAALGASHAQQQLKQQSYRDMVDAIYKGTQIANAGVDTDYKKALTDKARQDLENDKPLYPVEGTNLILNAKDFLNYQKLNQEDKPAAVKNYEYAKKQGYTGSFTEFQDMAKTSHKKDYDEAVAGGYKGTFNTWMTEMAKAGAINLGEKVKEHEAMTDLKGQDYFAGPWINDLNKHLSSEDVQQTLMNVEGKSGSPEYNANLKKTRRKVVIDFIENNIRARGGEIVDLRKEGKVGIWTVKWSSGKTKEIKHALDE